jgi:hypothetical protein
MKGKNLNVLAFFYYLLEPCMDSFWGGAGGGLGFFGIFFKKFIEFATNFRKFCTKKRPTSYPHKKQL